MKLYKIFLKTIYCIFNIKKIIGKFILDRFLKLVALTEIKTLFFEKYNVNLVNKVNPLKHIYAWINKLIIKLFSKYKRKI